MNVHYLHIRKCEHCGPSRVIHGVEKLITRYEAFLGSHPPSHPAHFISQKEAHRKLWRAEWLARLPGFALLKSPQGLTDTRVHALFEGADTANVSLQLLTYRGKPIRYFAKKRGRMHSLITFHVLPSELLAKESPVLLDDKFLLCSFLRNHNIPTGNVVSVSSRKELQDAMQVLKYPVIVKPRIGTRGRHTVLHINKMHALIEGYKIAREISTRVVVQEELSGLVYRFTIVDRRFVACALRDAPYVVGDGVHTVQELLQKENEHPLRSTFLYKQIPQDALLMRALAAQGLTMDSVLPHKARCVLYTKNSRLNGTTIEDMTRVVHPSIVHMFEKASALLCYPVLGFDAIFEDITIPLRKGTREGIIECNSLPYIDAHHFPYVGQKVNVSAKIWDMVYQEYEKLYPLS